jgi:hypothetical protein
MAPPVTGKGSTTLRRCSAVWTPHALVTALPVELGPNPVAFAEARRRRAEEVDDGRAIGAAVYGVGNGQRLAVGARQRADVARLPAALRVEDGAVEYDPALVRHGHHGRVAGGGVGVGAEQGLGGGHGSLWMAGTER